VPTVVDPRFPVNSVVVFSDTASVEPRPLPPQGADSTPVRARLTEWEPGRMRISLEGTDARPLYLVIGENWYPDWRAQIDGKEAVAHRGNHALLTVELPGGAREVRLSFTSARYALGRLVTLGALLIVLGLFAWSWRQGRRAAAHG
jgi:hypothetical protein